MHKNELAKSSAALAAATQTLALLLERHQHCQNAIDCGAAIELELEELRGSRNKAEAEAFLKGAVVDVSALDKQISAMVDKSKEALKNAQIAKAAADLLLPQIENAKEAIEAAKEEHDVILGDTVQKIFTDAEDEYHDAVNKLKIALARMGGTALLLRKLVGAGRVNTVESIIDSLGGNGTGIYSRNGLVVKSGKDGTYGIDTSLCVGHLRAEINAAACEIGAELARRGASL